MKPRRKPSATPSFFAACSSAGRSPLSNQTPSHLGHRSMTHTSIMRFFSISASTTTSIKNRSTLKEEWNGCWQFLPSTVLTVSGSRGRGALLMFRLSALRLPRKRYELSMWCLFYAARLSSPTSQQVRVHFVQFLVLIYGCSRNSARHVKQSLRCCL